jgi:hypothetical protein
MSDGVNEGDKNVVEEIQPDAAGKYPETVPWNKYVGIKESLGGKLDAEKQKVTSLEEQLKTAVSTDEFNEVKTELDRTKNKLQETVTELQTNKEKTLSEKRETLVKRGISDEKVKELSEKELDNIAMVLSTVKPKPDGGGGGSSDTPKSPRERIQSGFEVLHPNK